MGDWLTVRTWVSDLSQMISDLTNSNPDILSHIIKQIAIFFNKNIHNIALVVGLCIMYINALIY